MSDAPPADQIPTACPHCGKRFATLRANVGKQARCPGCSQTFQIAVAPVAGAAGPPPVPGGDPPDGAATADPQGSPVTAEPARVAGDGRLCAICQSPFTTGEATTNCPVCRARYHRQCWDYNRGCAVYGCPQTPATESLTALEIPASHWGKEDKNCPRCGSTILAAAVRCRHCGATFSSAAPQGSTTYHAQRKIKAKLPAVRTAGIWLLVFGLLTCTAPLAAVVGAIWYFMNRETIDKLPALQAAICRIAVGVAVFQTFILVLLAVVFQFLPA
jgi:hypothetical protein